MITIPLLPDLIRDMVVFVIYCNQTLLVTGGRQTNMTHPLSGTTVNFVCNNGN